MEGISMTTQPFHFSLRFSRLLLQRKLSNLQWMAITLLAVGTTTSQVKGCGEPSCDSLFSAPTQGYMLGVLSACLSALGGVYTEFLMKKNSDSLYWQNVQLYTFGAIFNMARLIVDDFRSGFRKRTMMASPFWWIQFRNLDGGSEFRVLGAASFLANEVYSSSMAMLFTMILSVYMFDFNPTLQLFLGIIICMMSVLMYFAPPSMLVDLPISSKLEHENLKQVTVERVNL